MKGKQIFEALNEVDDRFLTIAESYQKETKEMKHTFKRKTVTGLLAAVISISVLAVTAMANGWIPGIFQELKEEHPEDTVFEAAAQENTELTPEFASIPQADLSQLVLLEKYYDGQTILMGYDLDVVIPEPAVNVEMDKKTMEDKGHPLTSLGYNIGDEPAWMKKPYVKTERNKDLGEDARMVDWMMQGCLSQENYEKAWDILEQQGYLCLGGQDVYIGDHILVNGVDTITAYDPDWINRTEYVTQNGKCIRLDTLPEAGKNQETVTATLKVKVQPNHWYLDLEGRGLKLFGLPETQEVSFQLENSQ